MKNRQNNNVRTSSSEDFGNNEGYHNYQDRTERSFKNAPHFAERQRKSEFLPSPKRKEWARPTMQNADRFGSQYSSDASMSGADMPRTGWDFGSGSFQSGRNDPRWNNDSNSSFQGDRYDQRPSTIYGAGSTPFNRFEINYGSDRFDQGSNSGSSYGPAQYGMGEARSGSGLRSQPGLHTGKGPKGYRRSDERIREDVCETLIAHSEIDASEIEVEVKDGLVTLSGTVESRQMKRMTEDLIEHLPGVFDIRNDLRIPTSLDISSKAKTSSSLSENISIDAEIQPRASMKTPSLQKSTPSVSSSTSKSVQ